MRPFILVQYAILSLFMIDIFRFSKSNSSLNSINGYLSDRLKRSQMVFIFGVSR